MPEQVTPNEQEKANFYSYNCFHICPFHFFPVLLDKNLKWNGVVKALLVSTGYVKKKFTDCNCQ